MNDDVLMQVRDLCRENGLIRTPDALHIVLASRAGLPMATLDKDQGAVAKLYGVDVVFP